MNAIVRASIIFLISLPALGQGYTITTVAGGANPYFYSGTGDGGQATSAGLGTPTRDVTTDAAKNLYIVAGPLIRKVTPAGVISTVAGGGSALGEFVPATQAEFAPLAIVSDGPGNLYIADNAFGISRVRKVDTKGVVTTYAGGAPCCTLGDGGPATAAYLGIPYGLTLDASGNLYVAQFSNQANVIRKITPNGTISTVAGGGQATGDGGQATGASLSGPVGIAVDSSGDLYIAESQANRIREVAPGGAIITIAGSGAANNSGDGGPAFLAGIDSPWHVAIDAAGDLIVTQINDARIRIITPDGNINTLAGNGTASTSGDGGPSASATVESPAGLTIGNCGQIYVAQASSTIGRVRLLNPTSPVFSAACPVTYTISGQVTSAAQPLSNVKMTLTGATTATTQTDGNGNFAFTGLVAGNYTVTPTLAGYTFVPASQTFSNLSANQTANFTTTQVYLTSGSTGLSFSAQQAGSAPPSQTVTVSSSDGSQVPIAISALSAGNWLSVSTKTGTTPQSVTISVNPGNLPSNTAPYTGTVSISATGAKASTVQALSITVSLLITSGPPQLSVAPTSLSLSATAGGAAQTAQLQLSVSGGTGSLPFSVAASGGSWLAITPSTGTAPGNLTVSANPSGLSAGSYSGSIAITSAGTANSPVIVPVTFTVNPAPGLQVSPTTLNFTYVTGAIAPPYQTLTITSPDGTQIPFNITAAASNGGTWLFPGASNGTTPATVNVDVLTQGLGPGSYTGTITFTAVNSTLPPVQVKVSLTVSNPSPAQLSVDSNPINLSGFQGGKAATAQIQVSDSGGGTLNFNAAASGGSWLTVAPLTGVATGGVSPAVVTLTADPSSLVPGTYQGSVSITSAAGDATVPVNFSVASPSPVILISQTALSFTVAIQGGAPLQQQIGILNIGNGTLNWTSQVSTLSGGNWLLISPGSGSVQQPYLDVSLANVGIDPNVVANLTPGNYYGEIQIMDTADPALNSPQIVTVILTVLPAGTDPGPELSPSSLIFTGQAGSSPPPQTVTVGIRKAASDTFVSGFIGSGNLNYSPSSTTVLPNQPASIQVAPNFATVTPGEIDRGTITLQFLDGTARNISILTVVAPPAGSIRTASKTTSDCANLNVQWRTPSLSPSPYFTVAQGQGQTLDVQVVDDCGNLIGPGGPQNASVQATFSNGDPGLNLVHVGNGVWTGTWKPVNPSAGTVTVNVAASNTAGQLTQSGQADPVFGTIVPGATPTPIVTAGGVLQAASLVANAPLALGSLISIYGSNLAAASQTPQVMMGNTPLPVFYSSTGQLNVQVPYNLPLNAQSQLTVQAGSALSLPQQLVIADAQPGIFTVNQQGTGQGVIFRSDGVTLAQGNTPAQVGETIVIYCTGLGAVSPAVQAGAPAPANPPATTVNPVTVTIAGINAQVTFSGLTPGFSGLYQVNAIVPEGSEVGASTDDVAVVLGINGRYSPIVTMRRPGGAGGTSGQSLRPRK